MSEVAGEFESELGKSEVWAVAEAVYDETKSQLVILFGSSLRSIDPLHEDEVSTAPWLPERDVIRKWIPIEKAYKYAHELFAAWVIKVRRSIPTRRPSASLVER